MCVCRDLPVCRVLPVGMYVCVLLCMQAWSPQFIASGSVFRAQLLFMLAWFHAVVQERRTYVPQARGPTHPVPPSPSEAYLLLSQQSLSIASFCPSCMPF